LLALRGAALGYPGRLVARDVDLAVHPGDRILILGPNGSGKSTLLLTLLGLLAPLAGERWVRALPRAQGAPLLGYVPQHFEVDPVYPLAVLDLLLFGALHLPRRERRAACAAALAEVGLAELLEAPLARLSGGQRQRALIARALIARPAALLLDEPFSNVDLEAEAALLRLFRGLSEAGLAVLWVTHHAEASRALAGQVWRCEGGRVQVEPSGA
jgi:ABC-type Mn2+/Zn2+ transport system ATPase subunit